MAQKSLERVCQDTELSLLCQEMHISAVDYETKRKVGPYWSIKSSSLVGNYIILFFTHLLVLWTWKCYAMKENRYTYQNILSYLFYFFSNFSAGNIVFFLLLICFLDFSQDFFPCFQITIFWPSPTYRGVHWWDLGSNPKYMDFYWLVYQMF